MNKKGMTLVELITVLVVIVIIAVITIPTIIKTINKSKGQTTDIQNASIKQAANSYVSKNVGSNIFIDDSKTTEEIALETLVNEGYLKGELKNLKTNKDYESCKHSKYHSDGCILVLCRQHTAQILQYFYP